MKSANRFALKEWAVVCQALHLGRQSLLLRKGGIHEGKEGFQIEHREFWLYPTKFHQKSDVVAPDARPLLNEVKLQDPLTDSVVIRNYAVVEQVIEIHEERLLSRLCGLHVWSEQTVHDRFHYRRPGLFVLLTRIYQRAELLRMPQSPHFEGCRSWVDFPTEITIGELSPVLAEESHVRRMEFMRSNLTADVFG